MLTVSIRDFLSLIWIWNLPVLSERQQFFITWSLYMYMLRRVCAIGYGTIAHLYSLPIFFLCSYRLFYLFAVSTWSFVSGCIGFMLLYGRLRSVGKRLFAYVLSLSLEHLFIHFELPTGIHI